MRQAKIIKRRPTDALDLEEAKKFLKLLKKDNTKLYIIFLCQLMLGLRISDVMAFKYKDIENATQLDIIERKTGKQRKIIFQDYLRNEILEYFDGRYYNKSDYVFMNKNKTGIITVGYLNVFLKKKFKEYEIVSTGNISTHLFRKTFATEIVKKYNYSEKGIFIVNKLFQHANIQTTLIYLGIERMELDNSYGLINLTSEQDIDSERVINLQ
jgi:integrase